MLKLRIQAEKHKRIGPGAQIQPHTFAREVGSEASGSVETVSAKRRSFEQAFVIDFLTCA
jgi:hypothetical protein